MSDNKEENSGSDNESVSDDEIPSDFVYVPEESKPKPPPPRKKGPPTPEEETATKMKLAIHKLAGQKCLCSDECKAIWDGVGEDIAPFKAELQGLLNSKLIQMAIAGHLDALKFLLSLGAELDCVDRATGNTPLLAACGVTAHIDRQKAVITYLMSVGADCNVRNVAGNTAKSAVAGQDPALPVLVRELDVGRKSK